ncbi:hypothetical protein [Burkholderia semiarida]|uniref:hypothetical protein n=1 Tax=Burkholderia semiarida TaxID=2843303 RepID=UPI003877C66C
MMNAIRVSADFRTQHALRRRMVGIARDLDRLAIFDGHTHCACVRTIMRANGPGYLGGGVHGLECGDGDSQILRGHAESRVHFAPIGDYLTEDQVEVPGEVEGKQPHWTACR